MKENRKMAGKELYNREVEADGKYNRKMEADGKGICTED